MLRLNSFDREIIRFLGNRGESNTNEISKNLKISWATILSHLNKMKKMGYVNKSKDGELVVWSLRYKK